MDISVVVTVIDWIQHTPTPTESSRSTGQVIDAFRLGRQVAGLFIAISHTTVVVVVVVAVAVRQGVLQRRRQHG